MARLLEVEAKARGDSTFRIGKRSKEHDTEVLMGRSSLILFPD